MASSKRLKVGIVSSVALSNSFNGVSTFSLACAM